MFLPGKVTKAFKPGEEGAGKYEDGRVRVVAQRSGRLRGGGGGNRYVGGALWALRCADTA